MQLQISNAKTQIPNKFQQANQEKGQPVSISKYFKNVPWV